MYLLYTNILIYHFNDDILDESQDKVNQIFNEHFNLSIISKMEFLGFRKYTPEQLAKGKDFISYAKIFFLDHELADRVIQLRQNHEIKLPDAIIASTAIHYNFTLVTRNTKDFNNIDIKLYNPFEVQETSL